MPFDGGRLAADVAAAVAADDPRSAVPATGPSAASLRQRDPSPLRILIGSCSAATSERLTSLAGMPGQKKARGSRPRA